MPKLATTLGGILLVAAVSTFGDFLWHGLGVPHRMVFGVLHGVVLLAAVGGVLGAAAGRWVAGLPLGMLAGLGGALAYYALAPWLGAPAMVVAWAALWLILAFLDGKLLRRDGRISGIVVRGVTAAAAGGLAFFLVVDVLWGREPTGPLDYAVQLAAWTFAWTPGLVALTWGPRPR